MGGVQVDAFHAGVGDEVWSETDGARPRLGPRSRPGRLPTAAVLMQEYVRKGRSLRSVAEEHRLSVGELRELVVGYGLPLHQGIVPVATGTAALTEEYLRHEYEAKARSAGEIAAECGVSEQSVLRYLHRYGIAVRRGGTSNLTELLTGAFLRAEYLDAGRSAAEIAAAVGVSEQSVLRYLHRNGIPLRTRRVGGLGRTFTHEYLQAEYVDKQRSVAELAREHGVSEQAIRNWLKRRGIASRSPRSVPARSRLTMAFLHREYEQLGRSVAEIAAEVGVSEQTVLRYLHRHGIAVHRRRSTGGGSTRSAGTDGSVRGRPAWLEGVLTEEFLRREYLEAGRSAAEIARQVGASEQSVLRYLHRHRIEVRPTATTRDAVFTREYLEEMYVARGRSLGDIGREHGVSGETVRKWLVRRRIERRQADHALAIDRDLLERWYRTEGRSVSAIARDLGVSATTITKRLDRYGIERRPAHRRAELTDRDHLVREYVERGRTMAEIAEDLGVSASTVRKHLDRYGIEVRPKNAQPLLERVLSSDFLEREYVTAGRTASDIAREVGVSEQTVLRYLHRHDLPVRPAGFGSVGTSADIPVADRPHDAPASADPEPVGEPVDDDGADERLRAWLLGGNLTS